MADIQKSIEDVRKFKRQFGAMLEIADILEELGSVQQAKAEAEAGVAAANRELDVVKQRIAADKAIADLNAEAAREWVAQLKKSAADELDAARKEAEAIKAAARHTAADMTKAADGKVAGLKATIKKLEADCADITREVLDIKSEKSSLEADIAAIRARLG
jgi:hypothetical protein